MRGSLKYWLLLASCIALAFLLSYVSFFSFTFAARLFRSVPVARACDAAGSIVLLPAHFVFSRFGGFFDQSIPDSEPMNYMLVNATLLGALFYACLRPLIFRDESQSPPMMVARAASVAGIACIVISLFYYARVRGCFAPPQDAGTVKIATVFTLAGCCMGLGLIGFDMFKRSKEKEKSAK